MKQYNGKLIKNLEERLFEKDIFGNEAVWTSLVAEIANTNSHIFDMICGFEKNDSHELLLEVQPITPYSNSEGNTSLDMVCGAVKLRDNTESGIEFDVNKGQNVCFLEAKYFSDVSTQTEYHPIRNQIDRIIENLVCFQSSGEFPEKLTFTLLTPRIFKDNPKSRLYGYKLMDYGYNGIVECRLNLINIIEQLQLDAKKRDQLDWKYPNDLFERLERIDIRWVTYEEVFSTVSSKFIDYDITKKEDALEIWEESKKAVLKAA